MLTTWPQENPPQPSPRAGPSGLRARVGFRPNTPDAEAGMRIEPPPSLAWATGRMRAATAAAAPPDEPPEGGGGAGRMGAATGAAAPPDEPPEECAGFHGFRVGPNSRDSVVGINPN